MQHHAKWLAPEGGIAAGNLCVAGLAGSLVGGTVEQSSTGLGDAAGGLPHTLLFPVRRDPKEAEDDAVGGEGGACLRKGTVLAEAMARAPRLHKSKERLTIS